MKPAKEPDDVERPRRFRRSYSRVEAIKAWRADLFSDLGGEEGLPLMARELVEQATRLKVLLDRMDAACLPKPGEGLSSR